MIQCYIDESGTGLRDRRSPFFVLAATCIPVAALETVDRQVNDFKRRLVSYAEPEDFEIKVRELRRGDKFFRGVSWELRQQAIDDLSALVAGLPCDIVAVQFNKEFRTDYIASDDQLYAVAFRQLLNMIEDKLTRSDDIGMLMVDSRSDLHSSIQDRRLLDVYRQWRIRRREAVRITGLPWFGFSSFYVGLQIADFAAYTIDFAANEIDTPFGSAVMHKAFGRIKDKVTLARIP